AVGSSSSSDPIRALDQLRIRELYLACACIDGDAAAIGTFEREYLGEIDAALLRLRVPANAIDETKQLLRARFLVGDREASPGLAEYAGRGELKGWVRSSAVRAAMRVLRQPKGRVELDEEALQALPSPEEDLEIAYLKQTYGSAFEIALCAAFSAL